MTVRLGLLLGLNALAGTPLSKEGIFRLCADLEGHPDNAAPALFGGFTIARSLRTPLCYKISRNLRFVLLVPGFEVATSEARRVMPRSITIRDAAANTADAAVIAAAFATGSYDLLKGAFEDRIHQPHRMKLVPFLRAVVEAGEKAGSLGGWLSGSGSTICSLSPDEKAAKRIATAMRKAGPKGSKILICSADNKGARIIP